MKFKLTMALWFWLVGLVAPFAHAENQDHSLVVGVVPQFDARRIQKTWQPILDELTRRTNVKLQLSGSPSIPEFEKRFQRGDFDLVYLNPYHQVIANRAQGYQPILKDASKQLFGILVVSKASPIQRPEELEGKVIAFPAPNALGASLLMRAELYNKFGINIIPRYVKTHTSVYLNAALGQTSAGGGVMRTFNGQSPEVKERLRVIYETERVPPHPISIHPRVSAEVTSQLKVAFLAMGETETGRKMLAGIPVKQIAPALMSEYLPLSEMGLDGFYEE